MMPLMMMSSGEPYQIDKEYLREELKDPKHKEKLTWFLSKNLSSEIREKFKTQWHQTMETMEINIPMFTYFDIYAINNNIDYPFTEIRKTTSKRKVVSNHPPMEVIIKAQNAHEIIASSFKSISITENESRNASLKDIRSLQQQNTSSNQKLQTISSQLGSLKNQTGPSKCTQQRSQVGHSKSSQERSFEILHNIRCKKISDFRWYCDVFLRELMNRTDAGASIWKEVFLHGLPECLREKVKSTLRAKHHGRIPYDDLTYGDLISQVKKEVSDACTLLKLESSKNFRKELATFCAQIGAEGPIRPSRQLSYRTKGKKKII